MFGVCLTLHGLERANMAGRLEGHVVRGMLQGCRWEGFSMACRHE